MSGHSNPWAPGPPPVRTAGAYLLSIKVSRTGTDRPDALATKVLHLVAGTVLCGRTAQAGQRAMGRMFGRCERSIRRATEALVAAGYLVVRRRGKQLTNTYRLARSLWQRLTAGRPRWSGRQGGPRPAQLELGPIFDRLRAKLEGPCRQPETAGGR